jgi:Mn2+/Fe2+ NRAMP family transporter
MGLAMRELDTKEFDPYALSPDAIEDPPRSLWKTMRQIGPGLILAGAIVGTGELIATTNVGAKVGFTLLWLVIISCFIKVFVQAELGRYAISSGETTMASFNRLPGPGFLIGWVWIVMMLLTQLQLGAMVGGVGQAFHMAMPFVSRGLANTFAGTGLGNYLAARPEMPWAVLTAVGTSALLARGTYPLVEKLTMILVVVFTLVTVVCVALLPAMGHPLRWPDIASGFTFRIPPDAVAAAIAMFGITGVGAAELVAYPYWCIEKGYARKTGPRDASPPEDWLRRARGWLRVMRFDIWFSLFVYTVATLAFYFLGAAVLSTGDKTGLPGSVGAMLNELSRMYAHVLGPRAALWFIVIGVFAVLYSTLYAATAGNSRALADWLRTNRFVQFRRPEDRTWWVRLFCVIFPLIDLALFAAIKNPVKMVIAGGLAQALTLPLLAAAAVYLRYRRTDRRLAPGKLWDVFLWLSLLGMIATALYLGWDNVRKARG